MNTKWPLWVRIVTSPLRLIALLIIIIPVIIILMIDEDFACGILEIVFEWGLK